MSLKDKNVVVTGGSRGLGLGLVEALVAHGAKVTVVARGAEALDSVRSRLGVATISADATDETAAHRILTEGHMGAPMTLVCSPNGMWAHWSSSLIRPVALRRDTPTLTSWSKKTRVSASLPRFGMSLRLRLVRATTGMVS